MRRRAGRRSTSHYLALALTLTLTLTRAPLYLAIRARIYDVSKAWSFYGPGKSYHGLVTS